VDVSSQLRSLTVFTRLEINQLELESLEVMRQGLKMVIEPRPLVTDMTTVFYMNDNSEDDHMEKLLLCLIITP
jgi:virulence-associated protein VagC